MCYICPINHPFAPKGVQLSLVRLTKAFFGWIPSNCWIFHHSSSFLMTLGPSLSAFVSFLSYRRLFNVATSFVNGPLALKSLRTLVCSSSGGVWCWLGRVEPGWWWCSHALAAVTPAHRQTPGIPVTHVM